jgi:FtsH-binding integral membrane protein
MSGTPYTPAQLGVRPAPELVQKLLIGAFGWMFAGLLLSAGVAYLVGSSRQLMAYVMDFWLIILIVQLVLGIGIQLAINKVSPTISLMLFFIYAATMGLTLGVIVWSVLQTAGGGQAVASAFLSASGMFAGAAVYGAVTKRDLAKMGGILVMLMIGLFIAIVINVFLGSSMLSWVISIAGVLIFTGLTAWDVQKITNGTYAAWTGSMERASIIAALQVPPGGARDPAGGQIGASRAGPAHGIGWLCLGPCGGTLEMTPR